MSFLLAAVAGQGGIAPCGAPGTLSLANGTDATTQINLSWSAPSDTGGGTISGYHIQISTNGSSWSDQVADTSSTGTTYTASSLSDTTQYWFRVAGINEAGTGTYGNEPDHTTAVPFSATGGTITTYSGYKAHTFTSSGNFIVSGSAGSVDVLILAGGGGGGGGYDGCTGGAGGGGGVIATAVAVSVATHGIVIGAGGTGGGTYGTPASVQGSDSTALSQTTAVGGGRGGHESVGGNGGSGGGGSGGDPYNGQVGGTAVDSEAQGNDGGKALYGFGVTLAGGSGGGGGGPSSAGSTQPANATSGDSKPAGDGANNLYRTGSNERRGGGGGGGCGGTAGTGGLGGGTDGLSSGGTSDSATANTGGGSGGTPTDHGLSGNGGSGIVIIRYAV